jgi:hypothetical protein
MDFPLWEEELESIPGIEEKGSRVCVDSIGDRKCLSGTNKTHNTKEQPGSLKLPSSTQNFNGPSQLSPWFLPTGGWPKSTTPRHRWAVPGEVSDPTGKDSENKDHTSHLYIGPWFLIKRASCSLSLLMCKCLCMHAFYILGEKKMTLHSL